jgi:hypothetical protein
METTGKNNLEALMSHPGTLFDTIDVVRD